MASELTLHSSVAVPLGFLKRCLNIKCLLLDVWVVSRPGLDPRFLTCELQSRMGGPALLHKGSSDSAIPPEVGGRRSEVIFGLLAGPVSVFQPNGWEERRK